FYEWLENPLPEDEREDVGLVELHQFGNEVVRAIERDRLVMLVPTYLLDEIGWYTNKLGICLYVRRLLIDDELLQLNKILVGNYTTFHGVEQRIVVDDTSAVVVSGAGGEDDEPSDESGDEDGKADGYDRGGGQGDGENELPVYQSQWSAARSGKRAAGLLPNDELSQFGGSSSGSETPSNRSDLANGSSFSESRAGSLVTSDDSDEGGNGEELPRAEEHNSVQSMNNLNLPGVVSGSCGEGDEPSDGSDDEDGKADDYDRSGPDNGENEVPVYQSLRSATGSGKRAAGLLPNDELSQFGGSSSGSETPSNRSDLANGSSFSESRAGSLVTSDDSDEGGNGEELPRAEEHNSVQSMNNLNLPGVVSGSCGEGDEPSDGSDDEDGKADDYDRSGPDNGENEVPVYQSLRSATGSGKRAAGLPPNHELSEFGGSSSGSEVLLNHRDLGKGSSFSDSRAGSVGISDDSNEGGNDGEPPRVDERNSAQSMNFIWQGLCIFLCIFIILRWPAVLLLVFLVWFFRTPTKRVFEDGLNPDYDESSSAGDGSQENQMMPKFSNPTSEESTDISNKGIAAAELPPSTEETAESAGRAIVNNYPETTVERGNNVAGCIINGPVDLSVKNFNSSPPEGLEDPKFTIDVSTSSTAIYKNRIQEFTLGFKLKVMITQSSHQFELSNIVLGATEHLVKNKRYYFNNFIIKITPCNARVACPNAHPEEAIRHWKMKQSSGTDGIKWCHNVDKPAIRAENLRYQFGTYRTKYKWESYGPEPTEYLVDLNVGLTFFKSNFKDIRGGGNDYDLINSVSIRIKNIRRHGKVIVTPRTPGLTWKVAANVEMNRRELFWHLSSFAECQNCCELEAGIRPVNEKSSLTRTINNWRNLSFRGSRLT
ncbi:hypothetical protein BC938DRAFT_483723, partial [Jimgerdemannia flammicorona]